MTYIYLFYLHMHAYLLSLSSEVLEKVTMGRVLSQQAQWLLFSNAAHEGDNVGVRILSNFLSLKDVFEKNLTVFVSSILCKSKEVTFQLCTRVHEQL